MVIDDGAEVVSDVSPGSFTSLNIDTEMLFVGGTPLALPPSNLIRFRTTGEEVRSTSVAVGTRSLGLEPLFLSLLLLPLFLFHLFSLPPSLLPSPPLQIPPSTLGCVLSLSVNGVYTNFSSPQASSGTEDCRGFYTNVATFHGTGYLLLCTLRNSLCV